MTDTDAASAGLGAFAANEVDPAAHHPPFDWVALFGNQQPVEIEIGCGKGRFLTQVAHRNPDVNYLGVEQAGKYYRKAVTRLSRAGLGNVRLMDADGFDLLLDRWIAPASIGHIHVYFPDPWPKKRHHKRRLFQDALLVMAARALPVGGEFRVATDHAAYGEIIRTLFAEHLARFEQVDWPPGAPDQFATHYSLKWQRQGRSLWWGRYRRRDA
jgi:tRNA (guanine-N7-)-methyltransferase